MNRNEKHRAKYGTKEKETKKFFGRISFRAFALSLVALIQIALLLVGATYSWVETISSIKFDGATGTIGKGVNKIVKLTDDGGEVSLDNYFEQVGDGTHLAACSSADAKNFYFPIVGENDNRYRHGTINDKNVNYVDFDFQIKNTTTTEKSFRFDGVPNVPNNVRIAIWAEGDSPKILANKATKEPVVSSTSGSGTTESIVQPLKNYTADNYTPDNETNDSTIFKIGSGKTATVYIKLWLQQDKNSTTELTGDVVIENFKLASYTSQKKISVALGTDVTGGSVNINGTGDSSSIIANYGDTVKLVATAKDLTYEFTGWYDNAECSGTPVSRNATYSITVGDDTSAKYYAKFEVQPTRTIYYYNSDTNWTNIHFHAWEDKGASWKYPGEKAINVRGNYWSCNVPESYNRIIFNNNSNTDKTGDITVPTGNNLCYDSRVGAWTAIPKEGTHRIIVSNGTNKWNNNVYCYAWDSNGGVMPNDDNDNDNQGKKMTKITGVQHENNDIYYIDIDNKYTNVLFTNGSFGEYNQTVNMTIGTDDITYKIDSDLLEGNKYKLSPW